MSIEFTVSDISSIIIATGTLIAAIGSAVGIFMSARNNREIKQVREATNGMSHRIEELARKEGVAAGKVEGKIEGKEEAAVEETAKDEARAEGKAEGRAENVEEPNGG